MQTATLWELPFGDGFFISQNGVGFAVRLRDLFSLFSPPIRTMIDERPIYDHACTGQLVRNGSSTRIATSAVP